MKSSARDEARPSVNWGCAAAPFTAASLAALRTRRPIQRRCGQAAPGFRTNLAGGPASGLARHSADVSPGPGTSERHDADDHELYQTGSRPHGGGAYPISLRPDARAEGL